MPGPATLLALKSLTDKECDPTPVTREKYSGSGNYYVFVPHRLWKPDQIELGLDLETLCATVLQVLDTTVRYETSTNGRSVVKNAKRGSKTS
jgi:hypothetical protein